MLARQSLRICVSSSRAALGAFSYFDPSPEARAFTVPWDRIEALLYTHGGLCHREVCGMLQAR